MTMINRIVLIGLSGAGKSSLALELSKKLGVPAYDQDKIVLEKSGRNSIVQIFKMDGEKRFRELESLVSHELGQIELGVFSTGGGVVLKADNMTALTSRGGKVVFLNPSVSVIWSRIEADRSRPLVGSRESLEQLYRERYNIYLRHADIVLDTSDLTVDQSILKLLSVVNKNGEQNESCR